MHRAQLIERLREYGWTQAANEWRGVNSIIALAPDGSDDDTAVCYAVDLPSRRRAVSYAAAERWARTSSFSAQAEKGA